MNALDQALANAAYNSPKDSPVCLENIESIKDPTQDEPVDVDKSFEQKAFEYVQNKEMAKLLSSSSDITQPLLQNYQHTDKTAPYLTSVSGLVEPSHTDITYISIDHKLNQLLSHLQSQSELTRLRLNTMADMITEVSTTIKEAAQSMPNEPTLNHRSLEEWPDTTLLNELVNRENDLMPFYYELLKRIGSPKLQSLVMSSMQGKNASMVTLAQLCAAMGSMTVQPQPRYHEPTAQEYPSTVMSSVPPQQVVPQQQYFGQATEEYIRQTNNR